MDKLKSALYIVVAVILGLLISNFLNSYEDVPVVPDSIPVQPQDVGEYDYYHQLNDPQKLLYSAVLQAAANGDESVILSDFPIKDLKENMSAVGDAIENDHPEYFWFKSVRRASYYPSETGLSDVEFTMGYYSYKTDFFDEAKKQRELMDAVEAMADRARAHSEDVYQQLLFVHDTIIESVIYDHDALAEYKNTIHNPSSEYIFSAYGCLVNKKTVCAGYAKAFQLVLEALDVPASYACGYAGGGRHAWNLVYLNGENYLVDVTWDDYDMEKERPSYNYAFITDEMLALTHTPDYSFDLPVCDDLTFQYYRYMGRYDEKYDYATARSILSSQVKNKAVYIQYGSSEELDNAVKDLFRSKRIYDIPGFADYKVVYRADSKFNTLMIYSK